jgi:hypothetical protein
MIVLEIKFVSNENDFVSMSADVLGKTRDLQALAEEKDFESVIIPSAMSQINTQFANVSLVNNENLCIDMMNVLVAKAKQYDYILKRIGQNEKYPDTYQLEFRKEADAKSMGRNKEIREEV